MTAVLRPPRGAAPPAGDAAAPPGAGRGSRPEDGSSSTALRRIATVLVAAVLAALAFWIRYRLLTNSGGLGGGGGYDDGVYYAAADALVHGRLPYRDFLFLQPPGIVLVLAPFAWLGSVTSDPHGVVVGRVAFLALGAVNTLLVAAVCRRFGPVAAIVGGVGYAVFFPAAYAERTMLLEPVGTAAVLLALLLTQGPVSRRRAALVLAGLALGLAAATKIWYVVPAALIVMGLRDRRTVAVSAGFAASLAAILLPFLLAAPTAFVREVVLDQLHRERSQDWPSVRRIAAMLSIRTLDFPTPHQAQVVLVKVVGLVAVGVLLAALACTVQGARRFVVLTAAAVLVLLLSPSFFIHYGALLAPPLAITVGVGVQRLVGLLGRAPARVSTLLQVLATTLALLGFALLNRHVDAVRTSQAIPAAALRPAAALVRGCVTSDDPLILAELNVLSRDLASARCALWVDVTGETYDRDRLLDEGYDVPRILNERWQRDVTGYLLSGDALIVHRRGTGLDHDSIHELGRGRVLARSGNWVLHAVERR